MRTGILLAAAAALTLTLTGAGPSAQAQGGSMMSPAMPPHAARAHRYRAATAPKKRPAAKGYLPRSAAKGPGRCGTHMYWKGGKCVDARK